MIDWCNRLEWHTSSNVRANDNSHTHIPETTMSRPWFIVPESTCKWMDHVYACDHSQEGKHGVGVLFSTVSKCGTASYTIAMLELMVCLREGRT
jgi:hypothetical protein